jgi:hypothetical protein
MLTGGSHSGRQSSHQILCRTHMETRRRVKRRWKRAALGLGSVIGVAIITATVNHYTGIIWGGDSGPPSPPDVRVDAEASLVNPPGEDNGVNEYVCLVNESDGPVSLTAWTLSDAEGRVNQMSRFLLDPEQSVRVHPGGRDLHEDTADDLYGGEDSDRWTNGGDTMMLADADQVAVNTQTFPARRDGEVSGTCGQPADKHNGPGPGNGSTRIDRDCGEFSSHGQAQQFFLSHGGPRRDPFALDGDGDGIACE